MSKGISTKDGHTATTRQNVPDPMNDMMPRQPLVKARHAPSGGPTPEKGRGTQTPTTRRLRGQQAR